MKALLVLLGTILGLATAHAADSQDGNVIKKLKNADLLTDRPDEIGTYTPGIGER